MESYSKEKSILKARVAFEEVLDFVLLETGDSDANEAEKGIFERMMKLGLAFMQLYFEQRGLGDQGKNLVGEDGEVYERERLRPKTYFSIFGKLEVLRWVYRRAGSPGVSPLDAEVNLPERCYSYFLEEMMGDLSVSRPFKEVVAFFRKYFGHDLSARAVEENSRELAASSEVFAESKLPPDARTEGSIQVVSFDGKGVPMRKEYLAEQKARLGRGEKRQTKREALVGVGYTVDRHERTAEEVTAALMKEDSEKKPKEEERPRCRNKVVTASLKKPKKEVMKVIKQDAEERNEGAGRPLVCLLDGARSLWKLGVEMFPDAIFILDIIHVAEYIWEAAYVFHPEGSAEARRWVRERLLKVLRGEVGLVIRGLKITLARRTLTKSRRDTLGKVIGYFENNRRGMHYGEYLARGFPIGTGVVESACGHVVKDRMEGAGMRWTPDGAEAMLQLRAVAASGDWEAYVLFHTAREWERLYGGMPQPPSSDEQKLAA